MEGVRHHDPFLWDVEAVSEELCSLGRPCTRDPAALAKKIREEEVDGQALLTFEFVCSRNDLFESLNIRLAGHKAALGQAIVNLRSKSPAFWMWKRDFEKEPSEDAVAQSDTDVHGHATARQNVQTRNGEISNETANQDTENADAAEMKRKSDQIESLSLGEQQQLNSTTANSREIALSKIHDASAENGLDVARAPKRLRVAPTLLSSQVNRAPFPIATEADAFDQAATLEENGNSFPWERASSQAYLGKGVIPMAAIKSSRGILTTQTWCGEEGEFATAFPVRLPAGWRLIVSRATRKMLVKNGRTGTLLARGVDPMGSSAGDEELDLSDLPDSLDEETLREIEAEKADMEKLAAREKFIPRDRAEVLLRDAVDEHRAHWTEVKLPRYQLKAYKIWTDARKKGKQKKLAYNARLNAIRYDNRIKKLSAEILGQAWTKESEVRHQARSLEQSLDDKFYNLWLAGLLESRTEPAKPTSVPIHVRPATRRPQSPTGTEILTSEDEGFIEPDDEDQVMCNGDLLPNQEDAPTGSPRNLKEESPMCMDRLDLTQTEMETPEKPRQERHVSVIDLTTPVKPRNDVHIPSSYVENTTPAAADTPLPDGESFDVEQIGKQPENHWSRAGDVSRLIICMLFKLGHTRRSWIFEAARTTNHQELFDLSVRQYLKDGVEDVAELQNPSPRTMSFDITRLFLSYVKVKPSKEPRIARLNAKDKDRLLAGEDTHWDAFVDFVVKVEADFPVESQILRTDFFDDDPDVTEMEDDPVNAQGTPSSARKNAPREIIQNKAAVDLREREKRRLEEQEARRLNLRAAFDESGSMSRDQFRLVVNEAKQDDQSFIYINEETGKRIKDHQIDGVRFIWNQVVMKPDVRQGCLLAHTMGLGKTMQVITFLVAIQEAVTSTDPSVVSQIPEDLRDSKTLIMSPAGLVDNWMDELLLWTPGALLGALRKIEAQMPPDERRLAIQSWAEEGGVLVIGYRMLQKVIEDETAKETLMNGPNIVVADEAHYLKNPGSKAHQVCSQFKANCRIALTGSPLANNVEEYYFMIDWVAPNYLGPLGEFKEIYASPIQQGLWGDSEGYEKRKALKVLQVLKETVAPKVHRATIKSCLKEDLPPKHEFVLFIPPTTMQQRLYDIYVGGIHGEYGRTRKLKQHQIFRLVNDLALVVNHPRCLRQKLLEARQKEAKQEEAPLPESWISAALKETNSHDLDNPALSGKVELLCLILDEARQARDKVLVFSQSIPTLDYLSNILKMQKRRVCRLDGATQIGKRQDMIKNFNTGNQEVYLISTTAGGVGLNIQGANRVVIFDFRWNPVQEQQAIGRAYRIGQKKPVFVYRFVVAGSFEDDLQNNAVFKMQLSDRVLDKKNPVSWSKRLGSILHSIKPVPAEGLEDFIGKDVILDRLIRYKSNGEAIRRIVSTDTFEEEDVALDLSPEERRHAEDMVKLNRLRITDPKEYERQRGEESRLLYQQSAEALRQHSHTLTQQTYAAARLSSTQVQVQQLGTASSALSAQGQPYVLPNRTADGASDGAAGSSFATVHRPLTSSSTAHLHAAAVQPQVAGTQASSQSSLVPTQPLAAPLPMTGANTYFGRGHQPNAPSTPHVHSEQPPLPITPVASSPSRASIFNPPSRSQAKESFEQSLSHEIGNLQQSNLLGSGDRHGMARDVTAAIDEVRQVHGFGFLLDNQRWRLLNDLVISDQKFALATVSGHFSADYLALAKREELEGRLKNLPPLDVEAQLSSANRMKAPDPENLRNIRRSSTVGEARSPHAKEDMAVMRLAELKRQQRSSQLPTWAERALKSGRDRRSGGW